MLAAAVSREREHKGFAGTSRWFGQLFFPKFKALHLCISHVQGHRCQFWTLGAMRYGRFGGPISVWVNNYVCVATWKSEVQLTSCPLVQSLTVFLLLKVAIPTGGQIRWPHLRSDWRPRWANELPFVKVGQSGLCWDREFPFVLDNLISRFD